jgi:hypothetical protein
MSGFLVLIMYWQLNGSFHINVGAMAPTQVTCEASRAEGEKHFRSQGAIGVHSRCIGVDEKPEGLPEFQQQPSRNRMAT